MPEPFQPFRLHRAAPGSATEPADAAAEAWVRRIDAGLTSEEEVAFAEWLEADPTHEARFQRYQETWDRFAPLAKSARQAQGTAAILVPARKRPLLFRWLGAATAAAAVVVLMFFVARHEHAGRGEAISLPPLCEQLALDDGTAVELNRGARVAVEFGPALRRVRLERGEASFQVAKDPARPFVVVVGGVEVRAVGTAFNVKVEPAAVDVLVTEGVVRIGTDAEPRGTNATPRAASGQTALAASGTLLGAGQRAVVGLDANAALPQVSTLTPAQIEARLAWQPKMLDFDDAPLAQIVDEFNRRNPVRLIVRDPEIANRRMTAAFRSDNLEGFVRLLEANIGVRAQQLDGERIVLVKR